MRRMQRLLIGVPLGLVWLMVGSTVQADDDWYDVTRKETLSETVEVAPDGRISVDNVFGTIEVVGTGGSRVEMEARVTYRAEDDEAMRRAYDEVGLDIDREGDDVSFYVDGPFRDNCRDRRCRNPGYTVTYDFVLRVPRGAELDLSTVNDGDIVVRDVTGDFDVHNVNGRVQLEGLGGSGSIVTVNGRIRASWDRNPRENCRVKTINGNVELTFQDGLDADFQLDTMNGTAQTDFSYELLPGRVESRDGKGGLRRLSLAGARVRIGGGGPSMKVSTLNGDIILGRGD